LQALSASITTREIHLNEEIEMRGHDGRKEAVRYGQWALGIADALAVVVMALK
jgi:hypothetical protein